MKRRTLFKWLLGGLGSAVTAPVAVARYRRVLIQESPVAGFQFHAGEALWPHLRVGQTIKLEREPWNTHDSDAVAVYFHGEQLGYLPRAENHAVAQIMDRGEQLEAMITQLTMSEDPWERLRISVSLV